MVALITVHNITAVFVVQSPLGSLDGTHLPTQSRIISLSYSYSDFLYLLFKWPLDMAPPREGERAPLVDRVTEAAAATLRHHCNDRCFWLTSSERRFWAAFVGACLLLLLLLYSLCLLLSRSFFAAIYYFLVLPSVSVPNSPYRITTAAAEAVTVVGRRLGTDDTNPFSANAGAGC